MTKTLHSTRLPKKGSTAKVGPIDNETQISFLNKYWTLLEGIKYSETQKRTYHWLGNFKPEDSNEIRILPA